MATILALTAEIVTAHASSTQMTSDELLLELQMVYSTIQALESGKEVIPVHGETKPAITIKQAFKKNEVICMICGKGGMKTLARHLRTAHDLKPGKYRKQFGIPSKQPLATKAFSESRRQMAMERGLAGNLAKAREVRAAKLKVEKTAPAKKAASDTQNGIKTVKSMRGKYYE